MSPEARDPLARDQGIRVPIKRAGSVNDTTQVSSVFERVATKTPRAQTWRLGNLSDRAIAWLFVAPTVLLLLAINIFPLLWTIQLSFTNYRANRPLDLYGYSFVTILAGTLGFVVVSHFPE